MTAKELADLLDGREYGSEITDSEAKAAVESGLVVVFGASDDLIEFRGAINDEFYCYEGGIIHLDKNGVYPKSIESDICEECALFKTELNKKKTITALWCEEAGYPWSYRTEIPHETFDILEDGERYCRGIVFNIEELKVQEKYSAEEKNRYFNILRGVVASSYLGATDKKGIIDFITYLEEDKLCSI